jgi:hypothetical protein
MSTSELPTLHQDAFSKSSQLSQKFTISCNATGFRASVLASGSKSPTHGRVPGGRKYNFLGRHVPIYSTTRRQIRGAQLQDRTVLLESLKAYTNMQYLKTAYNGGIVRVRLTLAYQERLDEGPEHSMSHPKRDSMPIEAWSFTSLHQSSQSTLSGLRLNKYGKDPTFTVPVPLLIDLQRTLACRARRAHHFACYVPLMQLCRSQPETALCHVPTVLLRHVAALRYAVEKQITFCFVRS